MCTELSGRASCYRYSNPGQLIELAELMGHSNLSQVGKSLSDAERARAGVARL